MTLAAIAAVSANGAIGRKNQLPWHLPNDFRFFKKTTSGKPIVMGRNTYESLGRPLPNRTNVVLSANTDLVLPHGVLHVYNKEEALQTLQNIPAEESFVIGGSQIYKLFWADLDALYVTHVDAMIEDADAFFPEIDSNEWKLIWEERNCADEHNRFDYRFCKYVRQH